MDNSTELNRILVAEEELNSLPEKIRNMNKIIRTNPHAEASWNLIVSDLTYLQPHIQAKSAELFWTPQKCETETGNPRD